MTRLKEDTEKSRKGIDNLQLIALTQDGAFTGPMHAVRAAVWGHFINPPLFNALT